MKAMTAFGCSRDLFNADIVPSAIWLSDTHTVSPKVRRAFSVGHFAAVKAFVASNIDVAPLPAIFRWHFGLGGERLRSRRTKHRQCSDTG